MPRLLVSVRDGEEARAAIAGGCDILDVKDPARGSLGMADLSEIEEVVNVAKSLREKESVVVSAALGEVRDWLEVCDVPRLPAGVDIVKLGLAGLDVSDWENRWRDVRCRFEERARRRLAWIAVAYADSVAAGSPEPLSVVEAAARTGCAGVLLDTFHKDGRTLLDWMSPDQVTNLAAQTADLAMTFAVAGSLRAESLPQLAEVGADIVAVRTAACRLNERTGRICPEAVREFKMAMSEAFTPACESVQSLPVNG